MKTIKQIIDNQNKFKAHILQWLNYDLNNTKKELLKIKSENEFIQTEVNKLKVKFKKALYKKEIDKLFFMHPKRSEVFYAWWDAENQEVVILNYDKK